MIALGLLSLPQKIIGGALSILLLASVIYGAVEHHRAGQWQDGAEHRAAELKSEQIGHSITRASLDKCVGDLESQSKAVRGLADEGDRRTKAASDARAAALERSKAAETKAKALDASAATARPGAEKCPPSDVFWNQRGDL